MKKLLCLVLLLVNLNAKQLLMIQQTFRHGARFPVFPRQADHSDIALKMNSVGQLTNEGKNMHYMLGKIIYKNYWQQLFGGTQYQNKYEQSQFYVKSTDVNRTLQSAQSHLFGLLQHLPKLQLNKSNYEYSLPAWNQLETPTNISSVFEIFQTGPAFHPTAVHSEKSSANPCNDGDFLTKYDLESCPNQKFWSSENFGSDSHIAITRNSRIKQAIAALSAEVGQNVTFDKVYQWKDSDTCLKYLGYPRLKVFDDPAHSQIFEFIEIYSTYLYYYSQPDQIRAVSTLYFKQTLSNFHGKASGTFSPRIVIYSGHDTTVGLVLTAMNLANIQCIVDHYLNGVKNDDTCIWAYPQFTANVIFQLWNNNGQYTVRLLYNGQVRKIPICDYKIECTLTQFTDWVNKFAVPDVASACGYVKDQKVFFAIIFLILSVIVVLVFYIVFLHAKINKIDTIGKAKRQGYIENFEQKQVEEIK